MRWNLTRSRDNHRAVFALLLIGFLIGTSTAFNLHQWYTSPGTSDEAFTITTTGTCYLQVLAPTLGHVSAQYKEDGDFVGPYLWRENGHCLKDNVTLNAQYSHSFFSGSDRVDSGIAEAWAWNDGVGPEPCKGQETGPDGE